MKNIKELLQDSAPANYKNEVEPDYMDEDIYFVRQLENIPSVYNSKMWANVLCFCSQGQMEVTVGGTHYTLREGDIFACPSGVVVDNPMVSPDFKFTILALSNNIMQEFLSSKIEIWNRAVYLRKEHLVKMTDTEARNERSIAAWHFLELMQYLLKERDYPFRKDMVHSMLQIAIIGFCIGLKEHEEEDGQQADNLSSQSHIIFNRFLRLLRDEKIRHRPVDYYAKQLCITPKYLSFTCKKVSGRTATSFIHQFVVEEITALLKGNTLSIKEIATQMGFESLSAFGKYVKKHMGCSPSEFRRQKTTLKKEDACDPDKVAKCQNPNA